MYTIRSFQPDDMFSVIKLASVALTEHYNPNIFNCFYETFPQGFLIAEQNHKIIGFITGLKINTESVKILMLSVLEKHRKQGIGTLLLKQFIKEISKQKIKKIELEVKINNEIAIKFYKKNGFTITNTLYKFYQNNENGYLMKKNI